MWSLLHRRKEESGVTADKPWDNRPQRLEELFERYPDYPKGVVIKIATMIWGTRFSPSLAASEVLDNVNTARYYIFSMDMDKPEDIRELGRVPTYYRLKNIDNHKYGPVVHVRPNNKSPYFFDMVNGKLMLCEEFPGDKEPKAIAEVEFDPKPEFNSKLDSNGNPLTGLASLIFWGEFFYCAVLRACQYWQGGLQCKFCDLNAVPRDLRKHGIGLPVVKRPEEVMEALTAATQEPNTKLQYVFLSGGAVVKEIQGMNGFSYYIRFPEAIKNKFGRRYTIHLQTVAATREVCAQLHSAGVDVHEANIEVWDPELFKWICPAKDKYVGREEWIRRVIESVEVFGVGNVVPVFVQGVEMAQPYGFKDVDAAVESTLKGWDYLMDYGVTPRFDIWVLEPGSAFWESQQEFYPPPIEYFLKTTKGAWELQRAHGLPTAHGYPGGGGGYGINMFGQTAQWDFID